MSDLSTCKRDGCDPIQQSRGQMKPEDHHMQFLRYVAGKKFSEDHGVLLALNEWKEDVYGVEDLGPENANDVRVSCAKCGKATGWMRRDIEESRRHGDGDYRRYVTVRDGNLEKVRERWNGMVNAHGRNTDT